MNHTLETDPARSPAWRWQAAMRIASESSSVSHRSDVLIRRVATLIAQQRQSRTRHTRTRLREKCPTIATAQRIRFDAEDRRRDAIEARLLAGYPPELIAQLSALDLTVVWTYLALFFDVADRLDADDFIWTQVVGIRPDDGARELERKVILWLSWIGGPIVASALLLPGQYVGFAEKDDEIDDHLIDITQALLTRAMALAPPLGRLDREQTGQLMQWGVESRRQRDNDVSDRGRRAYLENVSAYLQGIELSVGRSKIPKGPDETYHKSHVEPRADEWLAIQRGEAVSDLDSNIAAAAAKRTGSDISQVFDRGKGTTT